MVATRFILTGIAAITCISAFAAEEDVFAALLKRQAPGTPAYNCHDNCGTAITISKASSDACKDSAFLADYANCLQCAGPDNNDIWQYYGRTLSKVGEPCGLSTDPLSGEQEDVGPAIAAGATSSSAASAPTATPTPTPSPEAPVPSVTLPVTDTSANSALTTAPTVTELITAISSGVASPSTNGTASFTASPPSEQTTNAASSLDNSGLFGVVVLGMMYGLGN